MPDLSKALREAPTAVKRQTFQAFDLQIAYDKAERRVEISATVSEARPTPSRTQKPSWRRAQAW